MVTIDSLYVATWSRGRTSRCWLRTVPYLLPGAACERALLVVQRPAAQEHAPEAADQHDGPHRADGQRGAGGRARIRSFVDLRVGGPERAADAGLARRRRAGARRRLRRIVLRRTAGAGATGRRRRRDADAEPRPGRRSGAGSAARSAAVRSGSAAGPARAA